MFRGKTSTLIRKYDLEKKIPVQTKVAKKIDEYNYVEIRMKSP